MAKKGKATSREASDRSGSNRLNLDDPQLEEIKDLEARQRTLKRRFQEVTDPSERRRLELEIKVLDWRLRRLRVRPHIAT